MRRTGMRCRLALAGGATLLTLTACGGGSSPAASSSSAARTSSSSAAVTSSPAAVAANGGFCGAAQQFVTEIRDAVEAQAQHQDDLGKKLPALVTELQSVTPPAAIADDWQKALSALEQLAQAFRGVNLSDPQQLQQFEQKVQPIETQLGAAGQHIDNYLRTQCGISIDSSSSTSP